MTKKHEKAAELMKFRPMDTAPKDGSEILLVFAEEAEILGRQYGRARVAKRCGDDWSIPYWKSNPPIGWLPLLDPESDVRKERDLLRAALEKVVGASSRDELEQMWTILNRAPRDDDPVPAVPHVYSSPSLHGGGGSFAGASGGWEPSSCGGSDYSGGSSSSSDSGSSCSSSSGSD